MQVQCSSCHGLFENTEAKCPFCGTFYYEGAEQQYLESLEDIVEDFEELREQPKEELQEQTLDTSKNLLKIFLKTAVCLGIVAVIAYSWISNSRKAPLTEVEQKAQILWEKETYPQLDQWYAEGEYDKIMSFYDDLLADENNPYSMSQWEPLMFLLKYDENLMFHDIKDGYFRTGELDPVDLGKVLISTLDDTIYYLYTEEEKLKVDDFLQEQRAFLQEEFHYSNAELDEIKAMAFAEGRFDREVCYKEAEERYGKRG